MNRKRICQTCFCSSFALDRPCPECEGTEMKLAEEEELKERNIRLCESCVDAESPEGKPKSIVHCIECDRFLCGDCCYEHDKSHRLEFSPSKPHCDHCAEDVDDQPGENRPASVHCIQCKHSMCGRCKGIHNLMSKLHTVIELQNIPTVQERRASSTVQQEKPRPKDEIDAQPNTLRAPTIPRGNRSHYLWRRAVPEEKNDKTYPEEERDTQPNIIRPPASILQGNNSLLLRKAIPEERNAWYINKIYLAEKFSGVIGVLMNRLFLQRIINNQQQHKLNQIRNDLDKSKLLLETLQLDDSSYKSFVSCLRTLNQDKPANVMEDGGVVVQVTVKYTKHTNQQSLVAKLNNISDFQKKTKVEADLVNFQRFGYEILECEQRGSDLLLWLWGRPTLELSTLKKHIQTGKLLEALSDLFKHLLNTGTFTKLLKTFFKPVSLDFNAEKFEPIAAGNKVASEAMMHSHGTNDNSSLHHSRLISESIDTRTESKQYTVSPQSAADDTITMTQLVADLQMEKYYPKRLSWMETIRITKRESSERSCLIILDKLIMLDYRARLISVGDARKKINPMDVMNVIYNCCDTVLFQTLMEKMFMCQLGLPLIFPDMNEHTSTLALWSLRGIAPECMQTESLSSNISLVTYPHHIFSFLRFGELKESKSYLLNNLLRSPAHDTFYHRKLKGGNASRLISNGTVEASWSLPTSNENPDDIFCVLNLRGESTEFLEEAILISTISSLTFLVLDVRTLKNNKCMNFIRACKNLKMSCVVCFSALSMKDARDNSRYVQSFISSLESNQINVYGRIYNWDEDEEGEYEWMNEHDFNEKFITIIRKRLQESGPKSTIEQLALEARKSSKFIVDEDDQQCCEARNEAEKLFSNLSKIKKSEWKCHTVPLQGDLWNKCCNAEKNKYRNLDATVTVAKTLSRKNDELRQFRTQQFKLSEKPSMNFIKGISSYLEGNRDKNPANHFFLIWIKMTLDSWSRLTLPKLKNRYEAEFSTNVSDEELAKTEKEIDSASFGLEHIFREFGQLYEATNSYLSNHPSYVHNNDSELHMKLPRLMAELVIQGFSLELMDGDAGSVPITWIRAVFGEIGKIIGEDKKVFVVTTVGIQSTGKSTLLNAMFGLKFAVSAGRCTKGVFCQMIPIDKEGFGVFYDYLLVIDTEGLCAPKLHNNNHNHDNELATFVVGLGNTTMINIKGENFEKMDDILQIVIHAMIRIKFLSKVQLHPSCVFIHQNVSATDAKTKLKLDRMNSVRKLDKVTKAAANDEKLGDAIDCFQDVIKYDENIHSVYFPDLWSGKVPMANVNVSYSEKVNEVKLMLIKDISKTATPVTLSCFVSKLENLWWSILRENFVFNFKNNEEMKAFTSLDNMFSNLFWRIQNKSSKLQQKLSNEIFSCQTNFKELSRKLESDIDTWMRDTSTAAELELMQHFEKSESPAIIEQWRWRYSNQLKEMLEDEKKRILKETKNCTEMRVMQVSNNDSSLKDELIAKAKCKAVELRTNNNKMKKNELEKCFKTHWQIWITELPHQTSHQTDPTEEVSSDVQEELLKYFKTHSELLTTQLESTPLNQLDGVSFNKPPIVELKDLQYKQFERRSGLRSQESDISRPSLKERYLDSARKECGDIFRELKKKLGKWSGRDFQKGQVSKIIYKIDQFFGKVDKKKQEYEYQHHFRIRFTVYICKCAAIGLIQMRKSFREKINPLAPGKEVYKDVYQLFKNAYKESTNANDEAAAKMFPDFFKGWVQQTVEADFKRLLVSSIVEENETFKNKITFMTSALIYLGEAKQLSEVMIFFKNKGDYWSRIALQIVNPKTLEKTLISIIRSEVDRFFQAIITAIKNISQKSHSSLVTYSKDLQCLLKLKLFCPTYDSAIFEGVKISDFSRFSEYLIELIPPLKSVTIESIRGEINMNKCSNEVIETLLNKVGGCPEECPLCGSPCCRTVKGHPGDHMALQHYPLGVVGFCDPKSRKLLTCNCQSMISSDLKFTFDENRPDESFKDYKRHWPDWEIPPDRSLETSSPYWKWIFTQFNKELAEQYQLEPADIPDEWTRITWQQAKQSLVQ